MRCLGYAQFLIYTATYMLLPVMPLWMVRGWGISYMQAGWITALFAPAMWIPGVFNSYLIDAFPRKSVALWGVLGCVAATVGMLYAESLWIVAALRVVQGMAFAVAIMAIGSTLAIDAAPSNRRSDSNTAFVWIARVGMAVGLLAGLLLYAYEGLESVWTVSAALGALALLCIPMVSVPFRAPLHAPLCTLDRFFLPRAWMPMCNLVGVVLVAGVVNSCLYEPMAYAMLIVGIVLAWAFSRWVLPGMPKRAAVELGQAATIGGLLLLGFVDGLPAQCIGALLTAMGVCFSSSYLFTTMIDLARHCERGSAVHSYHLLWELGMMAGVVVATSVSIGAIDFLYMIAIVVSLVVLGLFEGVTHPFKNV
jgi:MFS family permease